jgi:hypothetical protein
MFGEELGRLNSAVGINFHVLFTLNQCIGRRDDRDRGKWRLLHMENAYKSTCWCVSCLKYRPVSRFLILVDGTFREGDLPSPGKVEKRALFYFS